jgi:hypothetical protein
LCGLAKAPTNPNAVVGFENPSGMQFVLRALHGLLGAEIGSIQSNGFIQSNAPMFHSIDLAIKKSPSGDFLLLFNPAALLL